MTQAEPKTLAPAEPDTPPEPETEPPPAEPSAEPLVETPRIWAWAGRTAISARADAVIKIRM